MLKLHIEVHGYSLHWTLKIGHDKAVQTNTQNFNSVFQDYSPRPYLKTYYEPSC